MIQTTVKKGRPQAFHRTSWGESIQGLKRLSDGRWKVSGPPVIKYSEPDERLAVARFRQIQAKRAGETRVMIPVARDIINNPINDLIGKVKGNQRIEVRIPKNWRDGIQVSSSFDSAAVWAWLRRELITRPKWVAERVGIEQIGYLHDIKPPAPSPTLDQLIDGYAAKPGLSPEQVTRTKRFWTDFAKIIAVKTIREIEHSHIELFEKKIAELDLSPKSTHHRYSAVKTVIAYGLKRGKGQKDCRSALDCLSMLEVENINTLDPRPIGPADFWAVHAEAIKAEDDGFAALMLFALNCALYSSEAGAVRWDDIDLKRGEFTTRRNKTQVPRVAVLWPETVKALKALSHDRETVFNTSRQGHSRMSIHREWTEYRKAAGIKDGVTFAMIRDAAFTTACRVSLDQARVLAGHRLPGAVDHYVLRNPQFVAPACEAIRAEFYKK